MAKLQKCFSILNILSDKKVHKAFEIAKQIGTTEKIVRSYISYMRLEGINIKTYSGNNGGYKLIDCVDNKEIKTSFNNTDIEAIQEAMLILSDFKHTDYYDNLIFNLNNVRTKIIGIVEHCEPLPIYYEKENIK